MTTKEKQILLDSRILVLANYVTSLMLTDKISAPNFNEKVLKLVRKDLKGIEKLMIKLL